MRLLKIVVVLSLAVLMGAKGGDLRLSPGFDGALRFRQKMDEFECNPVLRWTTWQYDTGAFPKSCAINVRISDGSDSDIQAISVFHNLRSLDLNGSIDDRCCRKLADHHSVELLGIGQSCELSSEGAKSLLSIPGLKEISLGPLRPSDEFSKASLVDLPLERLELCTDNMSPAGLEALARMKNLRILEISDEKDVSRFFPILAKFVSLEELVLSGCRLAGNFRALAQAPALKSIAFYGCDFQPQSLNDLHCLPELKSLAIRSAITTNDINSISRIASIANLDFMGINFKGIDVTPLKKCRNLEALVIRWSEISEEQVIAIAAKKSLKQLILSKCSNVSNATLEGLDSLGDLEEICLYGTSIDDGAASFFARCPKLEKVNLGTTRIGQRVVKTLGRVSGLKEIDVSQTAVTDHDIIRLCECLELRCLLANNCGLQGDCMERIAKLSQLQELSLRGNGTLEGGAIRKLKDSRSIRHLDLTDSSVTPEILTHLMDMPSLRKISVAGRGWSEALVQKLYESHPQVKVYGIWRRNNVIRLPLQQEVN